MCMRTTYSLAIVAVVAGMLCVTSGCDALTRLFSDPPAQTPEGEEPPEGCPAGPDCASECFRPYLCAPECGAPTIDCGCCGCPAGMVDVSVDCPSTPQPTSTPADVPADDDRPSEATCQTDLDCQICPVPGCTCRAAAAAVACEPTQVLCVRDPCGWKFASCWAGQCVLRSSAAGPCTSDADCAIREDDCHCDLYAGLAAANPASNCPDQQCATRPAPQQYEAVCDSEASRCVLRRRAETPTPAEGEPAPTGAAEGSRCDGVGGVPCAEGLECAHPGGPSPGMGVCRRSGAHGTGCQPGAEACDRGLECRALPGGFSQCEPPQS